MRALIWAYIGMQREPQATTDGRRWPTWPRSLPIFHCLTLGHHSIWLILYPPFIRKTVPRWPIIRVLSSDTPLRAYDTHSIQANQESSLPCPPQSSCKPSAPEAWSCVVVGVLGLAAEGLLLRSGPSGSASASACDCACVSLGSILASTKGTASGTPPEAKTRVAPSTALALGTSTWRPPGLRDAEGGCPRGVRVAPSW
jgi:hypothetical protein